MDSFHLHPIKLIKTDSLKRHYGSHTEHRCRSFFRFFPSLYKPKNQGGQIHRNVNTTLKKKFSPQKTPLQEAKETLCPGAKWTVGMKVIYMRKDRLKDRLDATHPSARLTCSVKSGGDGVQKGVLGRQQSLHNRHLSSAV